MTHQPREGLIAVMSLFVSGTTLICCALPALLITLGLGAVMAGLITAIPGLVWFSEHKIPVFIISGLILVSAGMARVSSSSRACPADKEKARACGNLKKISGVIYWASVTLYMLALFFAFLAKYFV